MQRFLVFISFFTFFIGLAYYYVGNRILEDWEISTIPKTIFWTFLFLMTLLTPASYLSSIFLEDTGWQKNFSYIAFTSLGFITILLSLMVFYDIMFVTVNAFNRLLTIFRKTPEILSVSSDSINRKDFLINPIKL